MPATHSAKSILPICKLEGRNSFATFLISPRQIDIMKKLVILFCVLFAGTTIISCRFPDGSINIKHSQYDHYYEMSANFDPAKTDAVDRYLDKELATGNITFINTEMDAEITLNDKSTFHVKKSPGYLHIKFDKEKNSEEAFTKIKSVLDKIGDVVR